MKTNANSWRLIVTPAGPGKWNMAVDEAILNAARQGYSPPTIRFYAWYPACVSLGHAQPVADIDMGKIKDHSWDIVRRPTGGRAILHKDELTYSISGPESEASFQGDILTSYRRISDAILQALAILGISVAAQPVMKNVRQAGTTADSRSENPVCFEVPSHYEIKASGKKLVGSAQARRKGGVLQHGTIPLRGDLGRFADVLNYVSEDQRKDAAERIRKRATTIEQETGSNVGFYRLAQSLRDAFESEFSINLVDGGLSDFEIEEIERLLDEKYGNRMWNYRIE